MEETKPGCVLTDAEKDIVKRVWKRRISRVSLRNAAGILLGLILVAAGIYNLVRTDVVSFVIFALVGLVLIVICLYFLLTTRRNLGNFLARLEGDELVARRGRVADTYYRAEVQRKQYLWGIAELEDGPVEAQFAEDAQKGAHVSRYVGRDCFIAYPRNGTLANGRLYLCS